MTTMTTIPTTTPTVTTATPTRSTRRRSTTFSSRPGSSGRTPAAATALTVLTVLTVAGVVAPVGGCTHASLPASAGYVGSTTFVDGRPGSVPSGGDGSGSSTSSDAGVSAGLSAGQVTAANPVGAGRGGTPRGARAAPGTTAPTGPSSVEGGAAADPSGVAAAASQALFVWDTRLDRSPQDAARRVAVWMTPVLAARQDVVTGGGGVAWAQLAAADGYTTASTTPDTEPPPPTPAAGQSAQAVRRVFVEVTAHAAGPGSTGSSRPAALPPGASPGSALETSGAGAAGGVVWRQSWVVLVSLARLPQGWRVAQLVEQPAGSG